MCGWESLEPDYRLLLSFSAADKLPVEVHKYYFISEVFVLCPCISGGGRTILALFLKQRFSDGL